MLGSFLLFPVKVAARNEKVPVISISGLIAASLTILIYLGIYLVKWLLVKSWVPVEARLHHLTWKSKEIPDGYFGRHGSQNTKTISQNQCLYSYFRGNKKFYGIRTSIIPIYSKRSPISSKINSSINHSKDGDTIEILVSRKHPSRSLINGDFDWHVLLFVCSLLLGILFLGVFERTFVSSEVDMREVILLTGLGCILYVIVAWGRSQNHKKELKALETMAPD